MKESLKKKIGQLIMCGYPNEGLTDDYVDFCKKYYIGNFTVNATDSAEADRLCKLISDTRKMTYETTGLYPFVEIDQEGGWVTRFYEGAAMLSGAMSFTASGVDGERMRYIGEMLGGILRALGCTVCDSPVLDVNINPNNPIIGTRSYGETAEDVIRVAIPFMEGLQAKCVMSVVKHFPGHGNVAGDTHLDMVHNTVDKDTLRKTEFATFRRAFEKGVSGIMTAHVVHDSFTSLPATVSPEIMTGLLRDEMKFEGVAITDAMEMKGLDDLYPNGQSAPKAIIAGCDVLLYYSFRRESVRKGIEAIYAAVESGELTEERIDESYNRIVKMKERFNFASAEPNLELAKELIYNAQNIAQNFEDKVSAITKIKDDGILNILATNKILCVSPVCDAIRCVEEKRRQILSFADKFAESFENATACVSSLKGLTPEVEKAIDSDYDVAVVGIFDAASCPAQLEIVEALKKKGKPIVAVLLRSPYDFRYVKDCNAVITCYEYTTLSAKATVEAMKRCEYKGTMPVTLPLE